MSEATVKIVGIKKQASKNDPKKIGTTIYFLKDFDYYSVLNAQELEGVMCDSEFTYSDIQCHVGDEVFLNYTKGFQNRAQLSGVTVVNPVAPGSKK